MSTEEKVKINRFSLALISVLIGIVTIKELDCLVMPGIDQPFRWALNYFTANDITQFRYLNYTVGPLCLLKWPVPMGDHILISTLFYVLLNSTFTYLLLLLYKKLEPGKELVLPLLLCMGYLLLVEMDYVFLGIVAIAASHHHYNKSKGPVWVAICFTVVGWYMKASLAIYLSAIWLVFFAGLIVAKQIKDAGYFIIGGIVLYSLTGLVLLGSLTNVWAYSANSVRMSFQYSDAMSLYPYNDWKLLGISLLAVLGLFVLFIRQRAGYVLGLLLPCLFLNWKYAMGREDFWHTLTFIYLLALMLLLFIIVQRKFVLAGIALFIISISCFANNLQQLYSYTSNVFWLPDTKIFRERVIEHTRFGEKALTDSRNACSGNVLPAEWKAVIGNKKVDVIPYDLSYVMVNELNYQPRPSLQSGFSMPYNDSADAAHFHSAKAPEYIIWHAINDGKTNADGINGLYLPNTDAATIDAIYALYMPTTMYNDKYTIWQKRMTPIKAGITTVKTDAIEWGQWKDVPVADSHSFVRVLPVINRLFSYKLREAVYKGFGLYIEYETTDGRVLQYRFTENTSTRGLLANPLIAGPGGEEIVVKRLRFLNGAMGKEYFADNIPVKWVITAYR